MTSGHQARDADSLCAGHGPPQIELNFWVLVFHCTNLLSLHACDTFLSLHLMHCKGVIRLRRPRPERAFRRSTGPSYERICRLVTFVALAFDDLLSYTDRFAPLEALPMALRLDPWQQREVAQASCS